jgi:polysaccharide export outer membrane protein
MKVKFLLLLFVLLGVVAAVTNGQTAEGTRGSGVIGQRDTVEIRVFREDDLNTVGQLSTTGTITMPLVGAVKLAGLTTESAAKVIEAKLRDGYLVKPEVTVTIEGRIRRTVTVLGQAQNPGVFEIPANRRLTLVEAIGMAGGATRIANTKKITLKRSGGRVYNVNLKDITSGKAADIPLADGDVLNIPESLF